MIFHQMYGYFIELLCSNGVKLYLSLIMDLFSGEILSYGIGDNSGTLDLAVRPLKEAIEIVKDSKFRTTIQTY